MSVAAWVYFPPQQSEPPLRPTVLFAFPGGTYTRAYYDMHVPGRTGYSFAEHLAAAGYIVVACDHIGLGDSTPFEPFENLTKDIVINCMQAVVEVVVSRLEAGSLASLHGPLTQPFLIGVGHSMGAYLLTIQQGRWQTFDALAILGYSPLRRFEPEAVSRHSDLMQRMDDHTRPRPHIDPSFYYDASIPADVIEADEALSVRLYSWALQPDGNATVVDPEIPLAIEAIEVPVFVGLGATDMSPDSHSEPAAYLNSTDITLFVLPDSAHCFNLAESRQTFFDRLAGWGRAIVSTYGRRV
jgi:pimeloyl-ACP methyl ester carboxylesterase